MRICNVPVVFFKYETKGNVDEEYDSSYENVKKELGLSGEFSDDEYREEVVVPTYIDLDFLANPFVSPYVEEGNVLNYEYSSIYYGDIDLRMQLKVKMHPDKVVDLIQNYNK